MFSSSFSWGWCLPLLGLVGPGRSGAAVTYSGAQSIAIGTDFGGVYVDLDTGLSSSAELAGWDVNLFFGGLGIANSADLQPVRRGTGNTDALVSLQTGTLVQSNSRFSSGNGGSGADDDSGHLGPGLGQFTAGQSGLLGFKVLRGADTFYGWMRVSLNRFDAIGVVEGWAVEGTAGAAIVAGDTGVLGGNPWIIAAGTTRGDDSGAVGSDLVLEPGSDFTFAESGGQGTFEGRVAGTGNLRVTGTGGVRLNGNNPFRGTLTVEPSSALSVGKSENLGGAAVVLQDRAKLVFDGSASNNGALNNYGNAITFSAAASTILEQAGSGVVQLSGLLAGTGTMTKTGSGTLVVSGDEANTFSGSTVVSGGELLLQKSGGAQALGGNIAVNGGTLNLGASNQIADNAQLTVSGGGSMIFSGSGLTETIGTLTNSGGTFRTGANALLGSGNSITWLAGSTNTVSAGGSLADAHFAISGGTNVVEGGAVGGVLQVLGGGLGLEMASGGVLVLNSDNAVPGKLLLEGTVTVSGNGTAAIASGLALANRGTIDLGGAVRTFEVGNGSAAIDLLISAYLTNGGLIKSGSGALQLSAPNTYLGSTAISGGTLELSGAVAALSGTVSVSIAGGTLLLAGTGGNAVSNAAGISLGGSASLQLSGTVSETLGTVTMSGSAGLRVIDFGSGSGVLALGSLEGTVPGMPLQVWNWSGLAVSGGGVDQLVLSGGLGGAVQLSDIFFFSDSGSTALGGAAWVSGTAGELVPGTLVAVPEPGALGAALALLAPLAWRERRQWWRGRAARVGARGMP